jgi:2,4-diaminopentanoate dehydrogenase
MRRIKAVVYGVGAMNSIATRMMLEKGVDIVGALARSPEKVGRDLGEVAGLGLETGVTVEDDPDRVLSSRQADIAVIAVASYMSDMYEHLRRCAQHAVNAITISEEALYPWNTSPTATAELDRLARRHGVTLTGTGHQDVYWVNLVSMVLATAHRIDAVTGRASWNVDDYGPEVAKDQRVDTSVEDFEGWLAEADRPPSFGRNTLGALVEDLGLTVAEFQSTTRPEVAQQPVPSKSLGITVDTGRVIGFTDVDTVRSHQGMTLTFEMTGRLYLEGEADVNDWTVTGEPNLRLTNPEVPTQMSTCCQFVNRIPDVINAPPGFITMEKLPRPRYRVHPLGMYVDGGG